jgi:hypothetical protein
MKTDAISALAKENKFSLASAFDLHYLCLIKKIHI